MDAVAASREQKVLGLGLTLIFGLNLVLYGPLFSRQQRPYPGSIAAGYAGITRFVAEHPNPWGWNPQQYAGQPTQFSYPPLLPYTAAALHWVSGVEPYYAYRLLVGLAACLGPVTLGLAFYSFGGGLWWSLLLALIYTCCSPVYGLFSQIDGDRGQYYLPWRLLVLMKYGEGPHVVGLTMLPLILMAVRWGLARRGIAGLVVMAIGLAVAPLTNWLVAFALTITMAVWMLSGHAGTWRLMGAGFVGYGLSCFWLTPEYVMVTLFNWPKDAYGYQVSQQGWPYYTVGALMVGIAAWLLRRYRAPWDLRFWTLGLVAYLAIAGGFYLYGFDLIPESRRYVLEFELFALAAAIAWLRLALVSREGVDRACAFFFVLFLVWSGLPQMKQSVKRKWGDWGRVDVSQMLEYRLGEWLYEQKPAGRVFVSGALRFRLNAWFPLHQVSGTFESGLRNRIAVDYFYQVRTDAGSQPGEAVADARRELAVIGAEYAVVHGVGSTEYYKDIKTPGKFAELGQLVFEATPEDRVYKLPFHGYAHLVEPGELPQDQYKEALPRYYEAITDVARPQLQVQELNPSHWRISGPVPRGKLVSFAMNWDPGWRAEQEGKPVEIRKTEIGLMAVEAAPAERAQIELRYGGTGQQKVFGGISALVWIVSIGLCIRTRSWRGSASMPSS